MWRGFSMWRLEVRGGEVRRVEEPALRLRPGEVAIKVKAFLLDDFSLWSFRRGGPSLSRWAFGVIVAGGEVGRYVVAHVDNAAARYVASRRFVHVGPDPSVLEAVHVAYVLEALDALPRFRPVEVLGDDPRAAVVKRFAEVGPSRYKLALQGAVVNRGVAVAVSRLVEVAGSCLLRLIDVPSRWALERAAALGVRLNLPRLSIDQIPAERWGIVEV